jgi:phosphonate transport system permease protein
VPTPRGIASIFRNIDVSAWALILLFSFGQSSYTGFFALFFVTFGFMVRVMIETIDEVSTDSVEALRATGAGYLAIISQSIIPACLPQLISWVLFMIETNIRSATLVGILTGTGIGFLFDLYFKSFNYSSASLVVVVIVIAVLLIEALSNTIRRAVL